MDPTYNVALTEREIRALEVLANSMASLGPIGETAREFYRDINTIMRNRLARIEAEKGEAK